MTDQMDGQATWLDQGTWFGKTYREHSQVQEKDTQEKISNVSSRKSSGSQTQPLPLFLYLTKGNGQSQDALWVTEKTEPLFPSPGDYTIVSFGESPREENVSHLSQILVDSPQPKYCLSEKACLGILRRAEKRGKELPEILKQALENQINDSEELHSQD